MIASRFSVAGHVRNTPHGTVELLVEGSQNEICRFLDAVSPELGRYIGGVSSTQETITDSPLNSFVISY